MNIMIFIPGYYTTQNCLSVGDSYVTLSVYATEHDFEFIHIPLPNNNYGDIGNTTVGNCLEHVLRQYNMICDERNFSATDNVILAGHSMGGLIVSRLMTSTYVTKLRRLPSVVRMYNPAIGVVSTLLESILATLMSFVPSIVLETLPIPLPIAAKNELFLSSLQISPLVKPALIMSIFQTTGKLLMNNTTWDLTPDASIRDHITIIACTGDKVVSYEDTFKHASKNKINLITFKRTYHSDCDDTILSVLFGDV
jgi:hypothetical protein